MWGQPRGWPWMRRTRPSAPPGQGLRPSGGAPRRERRRRPLSGSPEAPEVPLRRVHPLGQGGAGGGRAAPVPPPPPRPPAAPSAPSGRPRPAALPLPLPAAPGLPQPGGWARRLGGVRRAPGPAGGAAPTAALPGAPRLARPRLPPAPPLAGPTRPGLRQGDETPSGEGPAGGLHPLPAAEPPRGAAGRAGGSPAASSSSSSAAPRRPPAAPSAPHRLGQPARQKARQEGEAALQQEAPARQLQGAGLGRLDHRPPGVRGVPLRGGVRLPAALPPGAHQPRHHPDPDELHGPRLHAAQLLRAHQIDSHQHPLHRRGQQRGVQAVRGHGGRVVRLQVAAEEPLGGGPGLRRAAEGEEDVG
uniref:Growth differentiation factor 6 n=1 Tax=Cairina moschata TaxID=8855 RepID=A0A8C3B987_CAIMO